jgi:hypothetical protein
VTIEKGRCMKKVFSAIVLSAIILVSGSCLNSGNTASAQSVTENKQSDVATVLSINLSKEEITLNANGDSAFIDATATYDNGTIINVNSDATWSSDNQDVAVAYDGRILAEKQGDATITVSYSSITKKIPVKVESTVTFPVNKITSTTLSSNLSSGSRSSIIATGRAMCENSWTPTSNLAGWRNQYTFTKGTIYFGIPYSQTAYQKNLAGFNSARGNSDFYSSYSLDGITMPKYGNDCSGLVSFSWGISRNTTASFIAGIQNGTFKKVGSYSSSNPSYSDLYNSYKYLQPGDAVVKSGHTFLIYYNGTAAGLCECCEQTPYHAQLTNWNYEDMASGGYMPFTE